jgi:UDP-2,3-diacylglucosamine pyrophosphatase LpxH
VTFEGTRSGLRARSVFLSDIHLGTLECQAERLLDFLESVQMDCLYLVGDIVDLWSLRGGLYWPQTHAAVLRTIFAKARAGTRVVFIPGNHDERFREFCGHQFGNIEVLRDCVHQTGDGRRLLVLHGDEFDSAVKCGRWMSALGTQLYDLFLRWGYRLNRARRLLGFGHWSLVTWLKSRVGNVRRHVERFERAAASEARRRGLDGVVCGHIHRPSVATLEGVLYCNDGDWVEHCTALVESHHGEMQLWNWPERPIRELRRVRELSQAA